MNCLYVKLEIWQQETAIRETEVSQDIRTLNLRKYSLNFWRIYTIFAKLKNIELDWLCI